jgi:hypothetical protein
MRSGLRLIFARRPDRRTAAYEGLTFHCDEGVASGLGGGDDFDPEACPLRYRRFGGWAEAEAWLRDGGWAAPPGGAATPTRVEGPWGVPAHPRAGSSRPDQCLVEHHPGSSNLLLASERPGMSALARSSSARQSPALPSWPEREPA